MHLITYFQVLFYVFILTAMLEYCLIITLPEYGNLLVPWYYNLIHLPYCGAVKPYV